MGVRDTWQQFKSCSCLPKRTKPPRTENNGENPTSNIVELPEIDPPKVEGDLKFERIDVMTKVNRMKHQTDSYFNKSLIVRRGEAFDLKLYLSDNFNEDKDTIILHFATGDNPSISKGSRVQLSSRKKSDWKMELRDIGKEELIVSVTPDPHAVVGRYSMMVETRREKSDATNQASRKKVKETIIVLFNPFCSDDDVYLEDKKAAAEYVMNETGIIYTAEYRPGKYGLRNWNYGQFQPQVLECSLHILEKSPLSMTPRSLGNIVQVLRTLSAVVNANDDNGIVLGNWSGDYSGGKSPTTWNGSVQIIQEYMRNKKSVKYGQCWVFAGVLTTVCRALGIPTRTITNQSSAHDTDGSCTIDTYVDEDGNKLPSTRDSIWNFHVWNEAWCQRPDLPEQYSGSGWQAFDSTPQEQSEYKFQCGPCPIRAIYNGEVHIPYDGPFIFAEVNADKVWWRRKNDGEIELINYSTDAIGDILLTKAVGKDEGEDVTNSYKPPERSEEERTVVMNAVRAAVADGKIDFERWKEIYKTDKEETLDIHLRGKIDESHNGKFTLNVENKEDKSKIFVMSMTASAKYTDGRIGEEVAKFEQKLQIEGGTDKTVEWKLPAEEYFSKMDDDAIIFVWAKTKVEETGEIMTRSASFRAQKPELKMTVSKKVVRVNEAFEITIEFTNPVSVTLTECQMGLECLGAVNPRAIKIPKQLKPKGQVSETLKLTAVYPGENVAVIASFNSRELQGISGLIPIEIQE